MTKVTLSNVGSLIDATTAANTINANNDTIETAFDNTLSRDGSAPNAMNAAIDMNSNQIFNLPAPSTVNSPARLIDVTSNPTIVVPGTGTSGHTVPFLDTDNTWSGAQSFNDGKILLKGATSGSTVVKAAATASGTINIPAATDTLVGRNTTDTLTNKSFGNLVTVGYAGPSIAIVDPGTSFAYTQLQNASNIMRMGQETTVGGSLFTGSSISAGTIGTVSNNPFQIFTNNTRRATFNAAGGTTFDGNILAGGSIISNTPAGGLGYSTGAGGAVTQLTSRTTGVLLNTVSGAITLFGAAPVVGTWVSCTVTNSAVAATDTISVSVKSGTNTYIAHATAVTNGTFQLSFTSISGTASDSPVINFNVIKGVAA
jgi:hypothetical protein